MNRAKEMGNTIFWFAVAALIFWAISLAIPQNQNPPHCDEVHYVSCPVNAP